MEEDSQIHQGEVVENDFAFSFREVDDIIQDHLVSWLNSSEALDPKIKKQILSRLSGLRTKFQVLMVEAQKKMFRNFVLDLDTEEMARQYLRTQLPFMSNKERMEVVKVTASVNEDRLKRLETQLTGFDFLNTTFTALDTLSEVRASEDVINEVKKLEPARRAKLLMTANEIIKEINNLENNESTE